LQFIPRLACEAKVREYKAERHARGFTSWTQLIAMLFGQLGHAQSLREITGGLAAREGKLRHLGVSEPPKRSTLSYANEHRPWPLDRSVFYDLLEHSLPLAPERPTQQRGSQVEVRPVEYEVIRWSMVAEHSDGSVSSSIRESPLL
jgi:Domain of unknown function (DUF4372)